MAKALGGFHRRKSPPSKKEWKGAIDDATVANLTWTFPQKRVRQEFDSGRDIVIYSGGNFGGKTYFAVAMAVRCALGLEPWCPTPADIFLVGLGKDQARGAFQRYLKDLIPEACIESQTTREGLAGVTTLWNGSIISVGTVGQGAAMHQGARRSLIIYDEEPDYEVFEEGLFRIREGMSMRILITATPTHGQSWVHSELVKKQDERNVGFVTAAIFENGQGECPRCQMPRYQWDQTLRQVGLSRDFENDRQAATEWMLKQIRATQEVLPPCPIEGHCGRCWTFGVNPRADAKWVRDTLSRVADKRKTAMRFLGSYEQLDGHAVFTAAQKQALKRFCVQPTHHQGTYQLWKPPMPGNQYTIGVDCARGTGNDETCFQIVEAATGEQVACWAHNEQKFTEYLYDLIEYGYTFNQALLVVELASAGEGVVPLLVDHQYPRLYRYTPRDRKLRKAYGDRVGFVSTQSTRNSALMNMIEAVVRGLVQRPDGGFDVQLGNDDALYVRDQTTVEQLCALYYNEEDGGKIQVPKGRMHHDDRVMALALAWEGRCNPSVSKRPANTAGHARDNLWNNYYRQERLRHSDASFPGGY